MIRNECAGCARNCIALMLLCCSSAAPLLAIEADMVQSGDKVQFRERWLGYVCVATCSGRTQARWTSEWLRNEWREEEEEARRQDETNNHPNDSKGNTHPQASTFSTSMSRILVSSWRPENGQNNNTQTIAVPRYVDMFGIIIMSSRRLLTHIVTYVRSHVRGSTEYSRKDRTFTTSSSGCSWCWKELSTAKCYRI